MGRRVWRQDGASRCLEGMIYESDPSAKVPSSPSAMVAADEGLLVGVIQERGEARVGAAFGGAAQLFVRFEDFSHGQALGGIGLHHFLAQVMQYLFQAVAHPFEVGGQGGGQVQDVAGGFDGRVVRQRRGEPRRIPGHGSFPRGGRPLR